MENYVRYFLNEMESNIEEQKEQMKSHSKEQTDLLKKLKKEIEKSQKELHELKKVIYHMTEKEGLSKETVAKYLNLDISIVNAIRKKQEHKMPQNYLNEEETKRFENLIEEIKQASFTQLFQFETKIFQFIDDVSSRYQRDIDNHVETEDELKILDTYSFKVFSMGNSRREIKKWLLRRLMNELNHYKILGIMKQTNLEE